MAAFKPFTETQASHDLIQPQPAPKTAQASQIPVAEAPPAAHQVSEFQYPRLSKSPSYERVKEKFGPLAITDQEREVRAQRDRRFSLNPLIKEPLSVEAQETKILEQKVEAKIRLMAHKVEAQAWEKGFAAGLEKGQAEALAQERSASQDRFEKLDQLLAAFEAAKEKIFEANERFLMDVIYRIGKMVLLKELETDRGYLLRLSRELISKVDLKDRMVLKVSLADFASAESLKEDLVSVLGQLKNLTIEPSKSIVQGGAHLETEWTTLEADLDTQLRGISDALLNPRGR